MLATLVVAVVMTSFIWMLHPAALSPSCESAPSKEASKEEPEDGAERTSGSRASVTFRCIFRSRLVDRASKSVALRSLPFVGFPPESTKSRTSGSKGMNSSSSTARRRWKNLETSNLLTGDPFEHDPGLSIPKSWMSTPVSEPSRATWAARSASSASPPKGSSSLVKRKTRFEALRPAPEPVTPALINACVHDQMAFLSGQPTPGGMGPPKSSAAAAARPAPPPLPPAPPPPPLASVLALGSWLSNSSGSWSMSWFALAEVPVCEVNSASRLIALIPRALGTSATTAASFVETKPGKILY
mmetsp:Transcript_47651/g.108125  ORF Transcript_47651/g.108125 Transcript_47651/m.108125 type:complete len:300 (-) Transcript_47651:94-993(-)